MMQKDIITIHISKIIAPILSSRDVIRNLNDPITKTSTNRVDLDFQDIQFISRSAAHELLRLKEEMKFKKKKELQFTNTNKEVSQMLRLVASNRVLPSRQPPKLKIKTMSISSLAK